MRRRAVGITGSWISAELLSILGTRLSALALPWLVLTTTGSATQTGLVAAAELAPMVLARALAGPLLDRLGAVRSAIVGDAVSALAVAAIPLLWTADLLPFPVLLILVAVLGMGRGPADSAKQTMLPSLAAATGQPLERVAGMGGTTERLASTVGLAVGGVVVAAVGGADALVVTTAGFALSALLGFVVLRPALRHHGGVPGRVAADRPDQGSGYLTELRDGIHGLRNDPVLVGIVIMLAVTNGVDQAFSAVLLPAWVVDQGHGASTLGMLFAVFMATAVLGALIATAWSSRLPRLLVYFVAFLLAGAPRFVAMALGAPLWVMVSVMVVGGLGAGFLNPIISAVILERTPEAVRGRVLSLIGAATLSLAPVGGLLGGVLADRAGLVLTLLAAGGVYFLMTLMPAVVPSWRDFGRRPAAEPVRNEDRADALVSSHT